MSTIVLGCLISPICRMVLLPFPLASSCRIVHRLVLRAVPRFAGRLVFSVLRSVVCSFRRASRIGVSLSGQQYASRRSAFCLSYRQAGRCVPSRHRIDKLAALQPGHHVIVLSVVPCCRVVRGVEAAFSRECVCIVSVRQASCIGYTAGTEGCLRYQALRHSPCPSSIASSVCCFCQLDIRQQLHFRPSAFLVFLRKSGDTCRRLI